MRTTTLAITATALWLGLSTVAVAHKMPEPAGHNAPKLLKVGCIDKQSATLLSQDLDRYNQERANVSNILRVLADDYHLEGEPRERMLAFAANFADMGQHLPPPDPDSVVFQNFDFKMGLAFTALTVFLHSNDDELAQRFFADRDNPDSKLAHYLQDLEKSRLTYVTNLESVKAAREKCS